MTTLTQTKPTLPGTLKAVRAAVAEIRAVNNDPEYAKIRHAFDAYTTSFSNPYSYENNDRMKMFVDRRAAAFDALVAALEAASALRQSVKSLNAIAAPYGWVVDGSSEYPDYQHPCGSAVVDRSCME